MSVIKKKSVAAPTFAERIDAANVISVAATAVFREASVDLLAAAEEANTVIVEIDEEIDRLEALREIAHQDREGNLKQYERLSDFIEVL